MINLQIVTLWTCSTWHQLRLRFLGQIAVLGKATIKTRWRWRKLSQISVWETVIQDWKEFNLGKYRCTAITGVLYSMPEWEERMIRESQETKSFWRRLILNLNQRSNLKPAEIPAVGRRPGWIATRVRGQGNEML